MALKIPSDVIAVIAFFLIIVFLLLFLQMPHSRWELIGSFEASA
jgi:hypothetical protein